MSYIKKYLIINISLRLFLEFEFNSKILGKMLGTIFGSATKKMMLAFEDRAKDLYRKS